MSKGNGASFADDYSPELHFSGVCVNHTSSTKIRLRRYYVTFYIFLSVMKEFFI